MQLSKTIRFSSVTYELISSHAITDMALETFEIIKPYLQPDKLTKVSVHWAVPDGKGRKAPLDNADWGALRQLALEYLTIWGGTKDIINLYSFQYWYPVNDTWPMRFDWYIDERAFASQLSSSLQSIIVDVARQAFITTNASTGYISYDSSVGSGFLSPYETHFRAAAAINMPHFKTRVRGYYWGNFLTDTHLEQIGGLDPLKAIPVYHIETLPNGYYIQLTKQMTDIPQPVLQTIAEHFAPILPQVEPHIPPQSHNLYQFVLDTPKLIESTPSQIPSPNTNTLPPTTDDFARLIKSMQDPSEAREWLANNPNPYPLANNRFDSRDAAQQFVESLYKAGAEAVHITMIHDEPWRLDQEGGPYAESLLVKLPRKPEARAKILAMAEEEMQHGEFLEDEKQYLLEIHGDEESISFWWD